MTIRIIDDEIVMTRSEYNEYMAQYNALAAQTRVCVDFEDWVRGQRLERSRRCVYGAAQAMTDREFGWRG